MRRARFMRVAFSRKICAWWCCDFRYQSIDDPYVHVLGYVWFVNSKHGVSPMNQSLLSKKGFSLIELICVIAIIGVLVGMLFPAIQQVREAARNVACKNKLRQLGLACFSFESGFQRFPPGTLGYFEPCNLEYQQGLSVFTDSSHRFYFKNQQHTSWIVQILPWIEERPLYDSIPGVCRNVSISYSSFLANNPSAPEWLDGFPEVQLAANTALDALLCPSDSILQVNSLVDPPSVVGSQPVYLFPIDSDILHGRPITEFDFEGLAPTNYAGCTGAYSGGKLDGLSSRIAQDMARYRGIFRSRTSASVSDVRDGSSQTVLLGETIGLTKNRVRSAPTSWFFGGLARGRSFLDWETGQAIGLPGLTVFGDEWYSWPSGFGSKHPSTSNFVFADGSTVSLSRQIDFQVFKAFCGCADGEPVE